MTKYLGFIGLEKDSIEVSPGIWSASGMVEIPARGDLLNLSKRYSEGDNKITDDLSVSNRLSILASSDLVNNIGSIRYATLLGSRWKIVTVEFVRPRINLTLGGVWNGKLPDEPADLTQSSNSDSN